MKLAAHTTLTKIERAFFIFYLLAVGDVNGNAVGRFEGDKVGVDMVGVAEGASVSTVGARVGKSVGISVGHSSSSQIIDSFPDKKKKKQKKI